MKSDLPVHLEGGGGLVDHFLTMNKFKLFSPNKASLREVIMAEEEKISFHVDIVKKMPLSCPIFDTSEVSLTLF